MSEESGNQLGIFDFLRSFTRRYSKRSEIQEIESDQDEKKSSPKKSSEQEIRKTRHPRRRRKKSSHSDAIISDSEDKPSFHRISKHDREAIRLRIRRKYGMVDDTYEQANKDDVEEFENVNARVRPAKPKMRNAKLRWKTEDKTTIVASEGSNSSDESSADPTRMTDTAEKTAADDLSPWETEDEKKPQRPKTPTPTQTQTENQTEAQTSEPKKGSVELVNEIRSKSEKSVSDIPILLSYIDELERAQKKSAHVQRRLEKKLAKKDVVIKELSDIIKSHQKAAKENKKSSEKMPESRRPVVRRTLDIIKEQRLLESSLKDDETKAIRDFFEAPKPMPNIKIINLIDKALDFVVYMLLNRSTEINVTLDDEMRLFLFNNVKAKQTLFSEMMANPEYLPREWGREQVIRRFQKNSTKRRSENGTDEDTDGSLCASAKAFVDFFYNNTNNQKNQNASTNENKIRPDVDRWLQKRAEQRRKKSKDRRE